MREHFSVAVAGDVVRGHVDVRQTVQRFARHRTGQHVAADDDAIDAGAADVVERGVERRQVAVDVVEGRDAHDASLFVGAAVVLHEARLVVA